MFLFSFSSFIDHGIYLINYILLSKLDPGSHCVLVHWHLYILLYSGCYFLLPYFNPVCCHPHFPSQHWTGASLRWNYKLCTWLPKLRCLCGCSVSRESCCCCCGKLHLWLCFTFFCIGLHGNISFPSHIRQLAIIFVWTSSKREKEKNNIYKPWKGSGDKFSWKEYYFLIGNICDCAIIGPLVMDFILCNSLLGRV